MVDSQEIQLQIRGIPEQESRHDDSREGAKAAAPSVRLHRGGTGWWLTVAMDMVLLLTGQTVAILLGRLYYNSGGNSKWMSTIAQSSGSPILAVPLLFLLRRSPSTGVPRPPAAKMAATYGVIGLIIGFDNLMYSYGLLYLPVSTYSLVAATQLAFNAVTARLINGQRFTALIANSVVLLTLSACLLGVSSSSDNTSSNVPRSKYPLGFVLTLSASAILAILLSLFELTFEKVIRARTLAWVLEMQMCTNVVATLVSVAGLFASGEWRTIPAEMAAFKDGRARYVATLVGAALSWQAASVGAVRLIARVSALFANVTTTVALPLVPVFAVVLFGDRMTGVKAVAMLMAVWGFLSYVYQHYVEERAASGNGKVAECCVCAARRKDGAALPAENS